MFAAVGAHAAPPFYGSDLRLTRWLKDNPPARIDCTWTWGVKSAAAARRVLGRAVGELSVVVRRAAVN
ncbi:MAG: hypothetical protein AB1453_03560 [Chloroflexota bacterium]